MLDSSTAYSPDTARSAKPHEHLEVHHIRKLADLNRPGRSETRMGAPHGQETAQDACDLPPTVGLGLIPRANRPQVALYRGDRGGPSPHRSSAGCLSLWSPPSTFCQPSSLAVCAGCAVNQARPTRSASFGVFAARNFASSPAIDGGSAGPFTRRLEFRYGSGGGTRTQVASGERWKIGRHSLPQSV